MLWIQMIKHFYYLLITTIKYLNCKKDKVSFFSHRYQCLLNCILFLQIQFAVSNVLK